MSIKPWKTTVRIDDIEFNAYSAAFQWGTKTDWRGYPLMGSLDGSLDIEVDIHDRDNLPWNALQRLLHFLIPPVRGNISLVKITYWQDDGRQDAICALEFSGFVSTWSISNAPEQNHILRLQVKPASDADNPYAGLALMSQRKSRDSLDLAAVQV